MIDSKEMNFELSMKCMQTSKNFIKNIFSHNAIKRPQQIIEQLFKEREGEGEIIQQSPKWAIATTWGLIGTATFAIGWLSFARTDEVVKVTGKLEPLGSVRSIQLPMGGIASDILVKDGEEVEAGQVLMKLDAETTKQRLKSLKESHKLKTIQLELKKTELKQYLSLNDEEKTMVARNIGLQKDVSIRYKSLFEL